MRRRPDGAKRPHSRWGLKSGATRQQPLDQHITEIVEFVAYHQDAFDALRPHVTSMDIFCGVFTRDAQGGFTLEPDLLRKLAELQIPVVFDLYYIGPYEPEDDRRS